VCRSICSCVKDPSTAAIWKNGLRDNAEDRDNIDLASYFCVEGYSEAEMGGNGGIGGIAALRDKSEGVITGLSINECIGILLEYVELESSLE